MSDFEFSASIDLNSLAEELLSQPNTEVYITGIVEDHFDIDNLTQRVVQNIDLDEVIDNIDLSDLTDRIYDQIDMRDLAQSVLDEISISSEVTDVVWGLLDTYNPYNTCHTGLLANDAIGNGMLFALEQNEKVIEAFKEFVIKLINPVIEIPVTVPTIEPFKYIDTSNNPDFTINEVTLNKIIEDIISFVENIDTPIGNSKDTMAIVWTHTMIDRYNLNNKKEG